MGFLHAREYLTTGDVVIVNCSHQCNVMVMDDHNFQNYRGGGRISFLGGFYKRLPARISVPHSGYWNVALDLGGGSAQIRHNISFIKAN